MRFVLVAIGLIVLLAVGWVLQGLMSDRDERDFAVHYSWIVKWALTLARDTHQAPENANFASPRIVEAGDPNRWALSGRLTWRDALGEQVSEPYTAIVENQCKAYADRKCWQLRGFAIGEAALALADSAKSMEPIPEPEVASTEPAAKAGEEKPALAASTAPEGQPTATAQGERDPVLALLEEPLVAPIEGAVPDAPDVPLQAGVPLPERKPITPGRAATDEDTEIALAEGAGALGDEDTVAALATPTLVDETDLQAVLAEEDTAPETEHVTVAAVPQSASPGIAEEPQREAAGIEASPAPQPEQPETSAEPVVTAASPLPQPADPGADTDTPATLEPVEPAVTAEAEPETELAGIAPTPIPEPAPAVAVSPAVPIPPEPATASIQPVEPAPDAALVVLIQDRLSQAGFDPGPVDGRMGARTQRALIAFQRDAGLAPDGVPSRTVLAALEQRLAQGRSAEPQPAVAAAPPQPALPQPPIAVAPVPAPAPAAPPPTAVPAPQPVITASPTPTLPSAPRSAGQPVSLTQPSEPPGGVAPDSRADESLIFLIQHRLREAGYSPGRFDGRMSDQTATAIRAYQTEHGLPVNGVPSRALLDRLESEVLKNRSSDGLAPTPLGALECGPGGLACPSSLG